MIIKRNSFGFDITVRFKAIESGMTFKFKTFKIFLIFFYI